MVFKNPASKVFGDPDMVMEGTLKNPNQYRDAIVYNTLSTLPESKINEFIKSEEAQVMIKEEMISPEVLDRLAAEHDNGILKTTVCHMAKETGDPLWDELVAARTQERRIMNELLEKYHEEAKPVAESAIKTFVEGCIPEYFRK